MSYSNPNTFLEHSGLFLNEVEITSIFCEGCDEWLDMNTAIKTYPSGNSVLLFDSCGCVRINNRHHLETKGSLLIKKSSMYDEDYESEDEDSDDEEDDDDEDSDDEEDDDDECFNMYVCQGCGEESQDPDFTECCEGHSVFAETIVFDSFMKRCRRENKEKEEKKYGN